MFPIGVSAPPTLRRPYVTMALVLACLAVFVRILLLDDAPLALYCSDLDESAEAVARAANTAQGFVCRYGGIPDELHTGRRPFTLVTALFVHAGWFHLLTNMLFLGSFGPRVEEELGHLGSLALFTTAGLLGGLAHVLAAPDQTDPAVGASGAVAGILGAHLLLVRGVKVRVLIGPVPMRLSSRFCIICWVSLQAAYAIWMVARDQYTGGTAYESHLAGFAVGLVVVGAVLFARRQMAERTDGASIKLPYSAQPPS